ncbi:Carrier domain-containing protein OS=Lysinibacillus sphaericus OX=1421 GN=LS41612_16120 PE=3 SV=1 [Lysinibacillus sphaericus]
MFASTVPIRLNYTFNESFIDCVQNISKKMKSILRHQKYPYNLLIDELRKNNPDIQKLFSVVVEYQPIRLDENLPLYDSDAIHPIRKTTAHY